MSLQNNHMRLSLDLTQAQHIHLKVLASRKGLSMREYILDALALKEEAEEESKDMDESTFRRGLSKIMKDKDQLIRNLSKR